MDFGILGEKVTGSIEAYYRRTFDLLNQVSAPLGTNFSNRVLSNVGEMENKGVELNLNYNVIETRDWHWSVGGNVTFQDVKIKKLTNFDEEHYPGVHAGGTMGSNEGYSSLYKTGSAPYTYYLYEQVYDVDGRQTAVAHGAREQFERDHPGANRLQLFDEHDVRYG